MSKLCQLEGIGVKFANILQQEGIKDQQALLETCAKPRGRKQLADKTGINPKLILKWTIQADLSRISGIGEDYAELLEQSGIQSVEALANHAASDLYPMLCTVNEKLKLVRQMPSETNVQTWISASKELSQRIVL